MKKYILILGILSMGIISFSVPQNVDARPLVQESLIESSAALYYHPSCSHCRNVLNYLNSKRGSITLKNVDHPQYRQEFKSLGQRGVPVLVVGSRVIKGDKAIISYLEAHPELMR